jgi:hypothetical protein
LCASSRFSRLSITAGFAGGNQLAALDTYMIW